MAGDDETEQWRIDELAQRAGLTVDTIRYYAREGLVDPPVKRGRNRFYGPDHLERLQRICELRGRRFSLAAIRALVGVDRPGLEGLFTAEGRDYTLAELTERSELDEQLVAGLRRVGFLPDPADFGGDAYGEADLAALRGIAELESIGMTPQILLELARIYVEHIGALQHDVLDMLEGRSHPEWDHEELVVVQHQLTAHAPQLIGAVNQLLGYVHQRTLQRLTLEATRAAAERAAAASDVEAPDARGVAARDA